MKKITFLILLTFFQLSVFAQTQQIINVQNRATTTLNGSWQYLIDPYDNGLLNYRLQPFDEMPNPPKAAFFTDSKPSDKSELLEYDWDTSPTIQVPGDWNHQEDNLEYYEGTIWYRKKFEYKKSVSSNRVFLHFGAVNYYTKVFLNGEKLGEHTGGFTPIQFEVTDLLKDENSVVLYVNNNRVPEGVPTVNTDWFNYGGITRDVTLIETSDEFISDYFIQLDPDDPNLIKGYVQSNDSNSNIEVTISIVELNINEKIRLRDGRGNFEFETKYLKYWSPQTPKLYDVNIATNHENIADQIGFRTIKTAGANILLNGESIFLRGISIHEENPYRVGRARSEADADLLLGWAKELGSNFVRLAHYPHNEYMIKKANELGLMVWEEVPVYWTIHWENESTYENASNQLNAMIHRDKNSAATIIWSLANETPVSEARNDFLYRLSVEARNSDPTRLLSAAMEVHTEDNPTEFIVEDKLAEFVDIVSFNEYVGWYNGLPEKLLNSTWKIPYDKPVFISEFGAGAKAGFHADSLTRFSEEYQADLYEKTLDAIQRIENLRGLSPWILVDFKSPRRQLSEIQDGWNRKGLIGNNGEKKQAFYILQNFYLWKANEH